MQKRAAHVANDEGVYEFEQHGGGCCRRPLWDAPEVELMQAKETLRRQEFLCSERSVVALINCFAARCCLFARELQSKRVAGEASGWQPGCHWLKLNTIVV